MSLIVSITNKGPHEAEVVSERISEDGRERFPNGVDLLEVGETQDFVVHARQSLRVVEKPAAQPAQAPAQASGEVAIAGTANSNEA